MIHADSELVVASALVQAEAVLAVAAVNGLSGCGELSAAALVGHIIGSDLEINKVDDCAVLARRLADEEVTDPDVLLGCVGSNDGGEGASSAGNDGEETHVDGF